MPTYVIVASARVARIFRRDRWGRVTEFERFVFPARQPRNQGDGEGQKVDVPGLSPRDDEISFVTRDEADPATQLAAYLRYARHCGEASSYVVVAPPALLDQLRRRLDRQTGKMVAQWIAEELVEAPSDEIVDRFQPKPHRRRPERWGGGQSKAGRWPAAGNGELQD